MRKAAHGMCVMLMAAVIGAGCGGTEEQPASNFDAFGDDLPLVTGKGDAVRWVDVLLVPINNKSSNLNGSSWSGDGACFYNNALELADWYHTLDSTATVIPATTPDSMIEELEDLARRGRTFDRVIMLGHGSGNGPMFCCNYSPQIGYDYPVQADKRCLENIDYLQHWGRALHDVTRPEGWIYVGACNPGKPSSFEGLGTFLEVLSCVSGRHTLGTNCRTACWDVTRRVKILEGPERAYTAGLKRQDACEVTNHGHQVACHRLDEEMSCSGTSIDNDWGPCEVNGVAGVCMDTGECGGVSTPGHCPGPSHIQCCTPDAAECQYDTDCDDGDDCTRDTCEQGRCVSTADEDACPACQTDADCDDGIGCTVDTCEEGSCVSTPDDGACPAGATCDPQDGCVGGDDGCDNDAFEPNENLDQAEPVTGGLTPNLRLCNGDQDWFAYRASDGTLRVEITFNHAERDLDLALTDAAGVELGASRTAAHTEVVELALDGEQTVHVVVTSPQGGADASYDLWIEDW